MKEEEKIGIAVLEKEITSVEDPNFCGFCGMFCASILCMG